MHYLGALELGPVSPMGSGGTGSQNATRPLIYKADQMRVRPSFCPSVRPCGVNSSKRLRLRDRWADVDETRMYIIRVIIIVVTGQGSLQHKSTSCLYRQEVKVI